MNVLAIDGGSASLKLAAYEMPSERCAGETNVPITQQEQALDSFIQKLQRAGVSIDAVGHRIVFGGAEHTEPERVTPELLAQMERLVPFVPLHLRAELDAVKLVQARLPGLPRVLCFDTASHQRMPPLAKRYPLGEEFDGIRRYGFHGLSLEYIVSVIGKSGRTIVAHLGNGASVSAIRDGEPVDTSMGFSPLGGIMMGTRPGDLDPGVLLYAQTELGITNDELCSLITNRSGLLGVSGISSDMRVLEERSPDDARAALAIELFIYIARKHIGALTATLGGLDLLVFTAGIGENSARVREGICEGLDYLRPFEVRIIPTNEALVISRHVLTHMMAMSSACEPRTTA